MRASGIPTIVCAMPISRFSREAGAADQDGNGDGGGRRIDRRSRPEMPDERENHHESWKNGEA